MTEIKQRVVTAVCFLLMFVPWTILPLRSFSWALESPVAETMIAGYALFMIGGGVFTAAAYGKGGVQNILMKVCLVVNGMYAAAGAAALAMMLWQGR